MFAKGKESQDPQVFTRYIGIAPVMIVAVNPDRKKLEDIYQRVYPEEPKYVTETTDNDGNTVKSARISFILAPDGRQIGFNIPLQRMDIFVKKARRFNKDKTKAQIIDKYGRSTWANIDDIKNKRIPLDKNGKPLNIDKEYRVAYIGEVDLTNLIRSYLEIPEISIWDNQSRSWIQNPRVNPEECIGTLEHIDDIFDGNFYEIQQAISYRSTTNKIRVMLGIRTDFTTGREYQQIYTGLFLKNSSTSYSAFQKEINNMEQQAVASGRSLNIKYSAEPVKEYKVEPTPVTPSQVSAPTDDPLGAEPEPFPWD